MPLSVYGTSRPDWECILQLVERRRLALARNRRIAEEEGRPFSFRHPLPAVAEVELDPGEMERLPAGTVVFSVDHPRALEQLISTFRTVLLNRRRGCAAAHPRPSKLSVPVITLIGEAASDGEDADEK